MAEFCGACGAAQPGRSRFCTSCGAPTAGDASGAPVLPPAAGAPPAGDPVAESGAPPYAPGAPTAGQEPGPRPVAAYAYGPPAADGLQQSGAAAPTGSYQLGPADVLPGQNSSPGGRRRTGRMVAVAAAALLAVGVGGAAVYAATALGGGGTQPEQVLPRNAIGYVKLDLDPSAGQKLAAYRLAKKFPDSGVTNEDSIRDDLLNSLLSAEDDKADYEKNIKPWLGKRVGAAVLPPASASPDDPPVVVAVQITDRDKAQRGLTALAADPDADFSWAFSKGDDYVLVAEDNAVAESAARQQQHLSDNQAFGTSVKALGGDQVALGWLDVSAVWKALPANDRAEALRSQPGLDPTGVVVIGAHVAEDGAEVVGKSLELSLGSPDLQKSLNNPLVRSRSEGLIQEMPGDSLGALSLTGAGDGLSELYDTFAGDLDAEQEVQSYLEDYGLRLPDDLRAVLGKELAVSIGGNGFGDQGRYDLRVRTDDPDRAVELLTSARDDAAADEPAAGDVDIQKSDGGYSVSYGPAGDGSKLGDSSVFRRTVPDAGSSGFTYYMDMQRLVKTLDEYGDEGEAWLTDEQRRNLAPLQAVGYTAKLDDGGNATFRFRVAVK